MESDSPRSSAFSSIARRFMRPTSMVTTSPQPERASSLVFHSMAGFPNHPKRQLLMPPNHSARLFPLLVSARQASPLQRRRSPPLQVGTIPDCKVVPLGYGKRQSGIGPLSHNFFWPAVRVHRYVSGDPALSLHEKKISGVLPLPVTNNAAIAASRGSSALSFPIPKSGLGGFLACSSNRLHEVRPACCAVRIVCDSAR